MNVREHLARGDMCIYRVREHLACGDCVYIDASVREHIARGDVDYDAWNESVREHLACAVTVCI